jgi:hypothetical protein
VTKFYRASEYLLPAVCVARQYPFAAASLAAAWLCGCSGSGVGLDSNGQPVSGSSSGAQVPLSADFDAIQANVFTPICSVCHTGATAPQGLRLDAAHSYSLLVNIPSTEVPTILRVKPGDPTDSYIIQKLEGHAAVGAQMPFGQPPLPASTIAFIVQWITDGAQPGASASTMAATFRIASVAPENEDVVALPPAQIVIGFTRDLDATRVDSATLQLQRISPTDPAAAATSVAVELSVAATNARALLLTPRSPLMAGQYRLVMPARAGAVLSARDGEPLSAAPPDSNGDRIISQFTVVASP